MYAALTPHKAGLFPGLEPVTSWSQCSNLSVAPRLTLIIHLAYLNVIHIGPKQQDIEMGCT